MDLAIVLTVTPNAALDRTLRVEALRPGERHRVCGEHVQAGGKGVNVSRVLARLGRRVRTVVLVGGASGRAIVRDLAAAGLAPVVVEAPGESRTCLEVLEEQTGRVTQIHGIGVEADAASADALCAAVEAHLPEAAWLALCGSLPPGLPDDTWGRLVAAARRRGVPVALDSSGSPLRHGWAAGPDLLRINRSEAAEALGTTSEQLALPPVSAPGPTRLAVVSAGPAPTFAWGADGRCWRLTAPPVRVRNPIGCGDAMLAGLLARLPGPAGACEPALRFAAALAAADAESPVAGRPDPQRAAALLPDVGLALAAPEPDA